MFLHNFWFTFFLALTAASGCGSSSVRPSTNLSTPEAAILSLEDAYRAKDIEAAVKCKDFRTEAILMLERLQPTLATDEEIIKQTTEVLELAFRAEMKEKGFPDLHNVTSTFKDKRPFQGRDDIVELTEVCTHSGGSSTNKVVVAKSALGWRVVVVPD